MNCSSHVYQGFLRSHLIVYPESTLIFIEAASAARTVSFTACIKFCALPTSISVASWSSSEPRRQREIEITHTYGITHSLCSIFYWVQHLLGIFLLGQLIHLQGYLYIKASTACPICIVSKMLTCIIQVYIQYVTATCPVV